VSGRKPTARVLDFIEIALDRTETRLVLGTLIVLSVLPFAWTPSLESFLLPVFSIELSLRLVLLWRSKALRRDELVLLAADAVALVSFLPIEHLVGGQALRLLRLARLVVLARFFRSALADLRRILSQRQIRYQLGFLVVTVLLLTLLGGTVLSTLRVRVDDFDGDGRPDQGTTGEVLWWTFRQIEDPGNLVEDGHDEPVLVVTSLVLTIAGVFVMSFIIGLGASVVGALVTAARLRRVPLRAHTVVVGEGSHVRDVLRDLTGMYAKNKRRVRVAVLGGAESPPAYLEEPDLRGVEYRQGEPTALEAHDVLATDVAKRVIVLHDDGRGVAADAYSISTLLAIRQKNPTCPVVVDMNHRRFIDVAKVAGGGNVTPVPMGMFLGCVMSQNLLYPGIDAVLEELLTARGSEIYTHIYPPAELEALRQVDAEGSLDFAGLLVEAYLAGRVILLGAFLGEGAWTDDVGRLVLWLNPLDEPPNAARALGARPGRIPLANLRGLVAVAPEYATLHRIAARVHQLPARRPPSPARPTLAACLSEDMLGLHRILVFGGNALLPAMVENAADFVPGIEVTVVVPTDVRAAELAAEFRRRGSDETEARLGAFAFELPRRGRIELLHEPDDVLRALDRPALADVPPEVIALLADHRERDPDAGTALVLLRLLERLRAANGPRSPRLRVVAEVLSGPKGDLLERRLERDAPVPVRIVPSKRLRSYFLVACAYVPGLERVHLELLTPHGQDFCQLDLRDPSGEDRPLRFQDLLERFLSASPPIIPLAVRLRSTHARAGLVLNPEPADSDLLFRPSDVEALFAVGDTDRFDHAER
jgi:hypothetical protein